ncbi:MAG TPA: MarR family winged helix-turn-helix transcriptional regulator [Acetobacteraceae bacterium]|jgi:DNA-binding MarR family transcriptional regulator|nr:MarR family winged helix-turn-helix transcriptional regulator [Acetobacteraceae bacterium]
MKTAARAMAPLSLAAPSATADFRLEEYLPYQLSLAAARVSRLLSDRYASVSGLTIAEWRVLATIARFGTVSPTAVVEWTAMDKVKVSRAATALATRGLVRQSPDPHDGRGRLLEMTRKGHKAYQRVVPLSREVEAALVEGVGRTHWTALGKALARLNEHVQHVDGDAVV